jgi:hypothetical protein
VPHRQACLPSASVAERPRLEVADIFRAYGPAYRQSHTLTSEQREVMWAIENCRTAALGGHLDVCTYCGCERSSYNSCRNRHCPKCQALAQADWVEQRQARILPTYYFHLVFTLPHELRPLARIYPRRIFSLLFDCVSRTLLEFGQSRFNAQLGFTAVLHTWDRKLGFHPHLHCIVTGGGLSPAEDRWVPAHPRFLFPVKALSRVFRGKFLDSLQQAIDQRQVNLPAEHWRRLKNQLYRKDWVVYSKRPFGGAQQIYDYLGRYTHRIGISNRRLIRVGESGVTFATKGGKTVTMAPEEFIRRFLQHVLPSRFVRIRHYGLLASSNATTKLESARRLLDSEEASVAACAAPRDWRQRFEELTGVDLTICPECGRGPLRRQVLLPIKSTQHRWTAPSLDSS